MSPTEQMLRAAFTWALVATRSDGLIKHSGPFVFAAAGRVKVGNLKIDGPHLNWEATGRRFTVSMSPAGRVLHYVDAYADHHSMQLDMKLPREFWTERRR